MAFRVLAAGNFPAHRTLCAFRKRHLADFKAVFVEVVQLAGAVGLVRLGTVAVDGTKVRANASKHKAMSYDRLKQQSRRLQEEIDDLCGQAQAVDAEEDARLGIDVRGDEMPEELAHRNKRLTRIRQAKADLEAAQRDADTARGRHSDDQRRPPGGSGGSYKRDFGVPDDRAQSNFTDPDSRIMKTSEGYQQCYNGQLVVDAEFQMIVANDLTANATDQGALQGLMHTIEDTLGSRPERLLADAGYRKEQDFQTLETEGIDAYIALGREGKTNKPPGATKYPATQRMADKLATPDGRERYRQRKQVVEAANGWIKQVLGFRRFSIRGSRGASGEWDLVCLATNLRRMRPLLVLQ